MYARLLIDAENTKLVVLSEGRPMYDSLSQYKYAQHGLGCFRVAPVTFHTQTGSSLSSVLEALHLCQQLRCFQSLHCTLLNSLLPTSHVAVS